MIAIEEWKIVHIPDKPPISPDQQPTVNIYAAVIDPMHAHTIVRKLNKVAPLETLRHVKRVLKQKLEGKTQLSVMLCLAHQNGTQLGSMPDDVCEIINSYQLSVFTTKVCKFPALSKEEWIEQCKLWPTSYHPPTYNIEGITGFSEDDKNVVLGFMRLAVDMAKSDHSQVVNAAVIVDPLSKQVVAKACDCVNSCPSPPKESSSDSSTLKNTSPPFSGVSCLYPWKWAEQESSFPWHPLRHACIVAIEESAERDKKLFPEESKNEILSSSSSMIRCCSPAKRQKTDNVVDEEAVEDLSKTTRPYLCTGYDIYIVWEPCTMCAMALVHQRIRRIFYAFPNPTAGALGSVHRLQGEKSLNHHYAVFQIMVPKTCI
ncbi:tRNA-specific adenosine deaminase TAD3 [Impatiens glandulifera]|uniref:tRNA-specific adenosine deaminase TAD3 n=1 Tax=Impatiens glandulifera TaxID=253017 RepID=UPI001FB197C9|nr:tRNA-specific adenosine deaminase TAD3 [Impatiens glandulifera]